jgi:hypothetical protein
LDVRAIPEETETMTTIYRKYISCKSKARYSSSSRGRGNTPDQRLIEAKTDESVDNDVTRNDVVEVLRKDEIQGCLSTLPVIMSDFIANSSKTDIFNVNLYMPGSYPPRNYTPQ